MGNTQWALDTTLYDSDSIRLKKRKQRVSQIITYETISLFCLLALPLQYRQKPTGQKPPPPPPSVG